jgi:leader peptidase (prepilin peptidase)/N-methyltransferase
MGIIEILPVLIATGGSIYIAIIDIQEMRIPNRILLRLTLFTLATMFLASLIEGEILKVVLALFGGLFSIFIFFFIHLLRPEGLGMGDVKFAGFLGLTMSWFAFPSALLGLAFAFIASAVFASIAIIFRMQKVDLLIPFGPFMVFGLLIVEFQHLF